MDCDELTKLVSAPVVHSEGVRIRVFPDSLSMKTTVCYEVRAVAPSTSVDAAVIPSMFSSPISDCVDLDKGNFDGFAMEKLVGSDAIDIPFHCNGEGADCYDLCLKESMEFEFVLVNCSSAENRKCVVMYPQSISIVVSRGDCYL